VADSWIVWTLIGAGTGIGLALTCYICYDILRHYMEEDTSSAFTFSFTTTPGVTNYYITPDRVPVIYNVYVSGIRLIQSATDADTLASMYNFNSRPGFFIKQDRFLCLFPTPDACYSVVVQGGSLNNIGYYSPVNRGVEEKKYRDEKQATAIDLMLDWLTPAQQECLTKNKYFEAVGSETKKIYRVYPGHVFNVFEMGKEKKADARWCFQPRDAPYLGDVMLAQKLTIEADEATLFKVANTQSTDGYQSPLGAFSDSNALIDERWALRLQKKEKKRRKKSQT
jgi:hypothetical protein